MGVPEVWKCRHQIRIYDEVLLLQLFVLHGDETSRPLATALKVVFLYCTHLVWYLAC